MSANYALGTVAIVTNKYGVSHPAIRTFDPNAVGHHGVWRPGIADIFYEDHDVTDVRPMLLVDPQDPEALAAALKAAAGSTGFTIRTQSGRAIDDGADFTPAFAVAVLRHLADPKPEEPAGDRATVRDHEDVLWTRFQGDRDYQGASWQNANQRWRFYKDIDVAEVLFEGYTPEAES